jgi:osmotically-inducible protein OsmY
MKKLTPFLLSSVLLLGTVACQDVSKTSTDAPNSTQESPEAPDAQTVQNSQQDAQSEIRRNQLNSDIRAREQRNNITGDDAIRSEDDLESEVRSKLEANIPKSQLTVEATEDGTMTVSGTIPNQQDLSKIEPLSKEIKGVKSVVNKVTFAPPKAQ